MTWWLRLAAQCAAAVVLFACSTGSEPGAGGGVGEGGAGGDTAGVAVTFDVSGPLTLAPGQTLELAVRTNPPGAHTVSFQILGTALDASLDRGSMLTAEDGSASVLLQAPGKATEFVVRAVVVGGPGAELAVRVSEIGSGTLRVVPVYGGVRPIERWTAAVVAQTSCAELVAIAPALPEGGVYGTAPPDEDLLLEDAPVGPTLAIVARSEQKAWGCANAVLRSPGEELDVEVAVLDRPLDLSSVDLEVTLTLPPLGVTVEGILTKAGDRLVERAFPAQQPAADVLLDAMASHIPSEVLRDFTAARKNGDLDEAMAADLTARAIDPRELLLGLLDEGRAGFGGALRGRLRATPGSTAHAVFALEQFADIEAWRVGAPTDHLVSFVANPGDTVVLGGALLFLPSRLAGALAEDAALATEREGALVSDVLAALVGCDEVAEVIGPLGDCDLPCSAAACRLGLGDVWADSLDASAVDADLGVLTIAVSGLGEVDDQAALVGFEGEWVGAFSGEGLEAEVAGPAEATDAPTEPEEDGDR